MSTFKNIFRIYDMDKDNLLVATAKRQKSNENESLIQIFPMKLYFNTLDVWRRSYSLKFETRIELPNEVSLNTGQWEAVLPPLAPEPKIDSSLPVISPHNNLSQVYTMASSSSSNSDYRKSITSAIDAKTKMIDDLTAEIKADNARILESYTPADAAQDTHEGFIARDILATRQSTAIHNAPIEEHVMKISWACARIEGLSGREAALDHAKIIASDTTFKVLFELALKRADEISDS